MKQHIITPSRRHSTTVTRRRQTRTPTRRRPAPLRHQERWLVLWHLRRGIVRPRLVALTLLIVWGAVMWQVLGQVVPSHAGPVAPLPTSRSARPTPRPVLSVAELVQAFYQGSDNIGWDSPAQHDRWWLSACAPAALTEVLRAWGTNVGIGPVLDKLVAAQAITPERGLLDANALAAVARSYGDQAETFWRWSVELLAQVTGQGVPVLVHVVDTHQRWYPAFDVGHWLVIVRVSPDSVTVRDSSGYHIHTLAPAAFRTLFTGIGVVVWRGALSLPSCSENGAGAWFTINRRP